MLPGAVAYISPTSPAYLPYIYPTSPYISLTSPPHLPHISPASPPYLAISPSIFELKCEVLWARVYLCELVLGEMPGPTQVF